MSTSRVQHYRKRLTALRSERSSIQNHWQQLSDNVLGFRGRFLVSDRNKQKRNTTILNNTGRLAARTLASGMMAGITSPARPWFKLGTIDPELKEYGPVKVWLHDVELRMREVFSQSNVYNVLHSLYSELGVFGTAPMGLYADYDNVVRAVPYTAGSYYLATNGKNQVDSFYREYQQTVAQLVKEFGLENCTDSTREQWNRGNTETWVDVVHVIELNSKEDQQRTGNRMPYRSAYFEKNTTRDQFLRESGFEDFPIMAPRWDLAGDDIYGTNCPGMDALGDIKALQLHERRKSQAIDKLVDPPTQAPMSLQKQIHGNGFLPGDMTFVPDTTAGIRSIYDFRPDINALSMDIREDEFRVKRAFYEDLFLMLANSDRRQITAREVEERHEEKLLMLGPVLERIHNELLDPLITRTFGMMSRAGVLPPAPEELQDRDLNVEYISVLAQAQKLTAVAGLERLAGYATNIAQVWPEARHKFDAMQSIDEYSTALGVSPRVIVDDKKAEAAVNAEQQQARFAAAVENAEKMGSAAQKASNTDLESPNVLARSMGLA